NAASPLQESRTASILSPFAPSIARQLRDRRRPGPSRYRILQSERPIRSMACDDRDNRSHHGGITRRGSHRAVSRGNAAPAHVTRGSGTPEIVNANPRLRYTFIAISAFRVSV